MRRWAHIHEAAPEKFLAPLSFFPAFQWCWQLGAHRQAPLLSFFSCLSVVLTAGGAPPGTSAFLLFSPFSGAGSWGRTAGHLCFPSFLSFQRCWRPWTYRRAPLLHPFSHFSAVLASLGAPPDTTVSPFFPLFSGVPPRHYESVSIFLSSFLHEVSTFLLRMKIAHSPPQKFVLTKEDADRPNRSPSPLLLPSISSMASRTIHQFPCPQTFL